MEFLAKAVINSVEGKTAKAKKEAKEEALELANDWLDVYKRQRENNRLFLFGKRERRFGRFVAESFSYTHLDVYKRQNRCKRIAAFLYVNRYCTRSCKSVKYISEVVLWQTQEKTKFQQ